MNAVPFHATIRIRLGSGSAVKDNQGNVMGSHVTVSVIKNKVAAPFRKCEFDILFGKGIDESEQLFEICESWCKGHNVLMERGKVTLKLSVGGTKWKEFTASDVETGEVLIEKKFPKREFMSVIRDPEYAPFIEKIIDDALTIHYDDAEISDDGGESPVSDEGGDE